MSSLAKAAHVTADRLREVLHYDPGTGVFTWRISRPGCVAGRVAGTTGTTGYRQIEIDYVLYRGSRLAWLYMTGNWPRPGLLVDHKNGKRSDDRWENLREATFTQNARNRGTCRRNTSGRLGVFPIDGGARWGADIGVGGRNIHLGRFAEKADAIAARVSAEKHYYGEFRRQDTFSRQAREDRPPHGPALGARQNLPTSVSFTYGQAAR